MKKRKKSALAYWFDNQMAEGEATLMKLLSVLAVMMAFVLGIFAGIVGYGGGEGTARLMNPGGDLAAPLFMAAMFLGILLTSTLTSVVCNAMDARRGKSVVVEEGHVVILGTAGGLYTIVSELIEANSNHPREAVVIMDDKESRDVMDDKINARFPDKKTTRIICRYGNITDETDLEACSLDTCMSVIINAESDAVTVQSIMAVVSLLKKYRNHKAHIAALIRDEQNMEAAQLAGGNYVEILSYEDVICRLAAHAGRYAGLPLVYVDLFDMDGSEFYIEDHPDAAGKTLRELNRYFPRSIVVGFVTPENEILLNPEPERRAQPGDRIILFAEDDGVSHMDRDPAAVREETILKEYRKEPPEKTDMLILGYSRKLRRILAEEDHYVAPGSTMTVALPEGQSAHRKALESMAFENIKVEVVERDIRDRGVLEQLLVPGMRVLLLAEDEEDMNGETAENRDAKTLMTLLRLRYLSETKGYKLNLTSEMLRVETQSASINDFVLSKNLTSLILTQICQTRELSRIFSELLREEGSELYVRPAGNYVVAGQKTDIYTACEAAARQREILIGYRIVDPDTGEMEIVTNPPKAREIVFGESDSFVVIALD